MSVLETFRKNSAKKVAVAAMCIGLILFVLVRDSSETKISESTNPKDVLQSEVPTTNVTVKEDKVPEPSLEEKWEIVLSKPLTTQGWRQAKAEDNAFAFLHPPALEPTDLRDGNGDLGDPMLGIPVEQYFGFFGPLEFPLYDGKPLWSSEMYTYAVNVTVSRNGTCLKPMEGTGLTLIEESTIGGEILRVFQMFEVGSVRYAPANLVTRCLPTGEIVSAFDFYGSDSTWNRRYMTAIEKAIVHSFHSTK